MYLRTGFFPLFFHLYLTVLYIPVQGQLQAVGTCLLYTSIVKELDEGEGYPEMDKLAHTILDTLDLNKDGEDVHMAYGTIVNELKEVSRSYKEARMALDVGKIFFGDKEVIAYSSLGIGRLIYQLPIPLCKICLLYTSRCV